MDRIAITPAEISLPESVRDPARARRAAASFHSLDLSECLRAIAEGSRDLLGAGAALVPIFLPEGPALGSAGLRRLPIPSAVLAPDAFRDEASLLSWAASVSAIPPLPALAPLACERADSGCQTRSSLALLAPIPLPDGSSARIACLPRPSGEPYCDSDRLLLEFLAARAALALAQSLSALAAARSLERSESAQASSASLASRLLAANSRLEQLSLYDPLTGLPNRTLFLDRLRQEIARSGSDPESDPISVLLIDLDDFSDINDTLGAEAGDAVLFHVAASLKASCSASSACSPLGTIARLGGDEFAAILPGIPSEAALAFASSLLSALDKPLLLDGERVSCRASIGSATFPADGADPAALLRRSEAAMYAAKRDKIGAAAFRSSLEERSRGRLSLASDLRLALSQGQFELHLQPQLSIAARDVVACEALARWRHPQQGLLSPALFIPCLEQTGLIHEFSVWALRSCAALRQDWLARGLDLPISVNIPVSTLVAPSFREALLSMASEGVRLQGLVLEITETVFLSDCSRVDQTLSEMRSLGLEFSIDDFGTGHSSLSRLRSMPVSEIKIDKSFVSGMLSDRNDMAIVRSVLHLAEGIGARAVAEGVETPSELAALSSMGCEIAQGYLISRPVPRAEFEALLARRPWLELFPSSPSRPPRF